MTCSICGAPERWTAPSPITGRVQGWRRVMVELRSGRRCADRDACRRRRDEQQTRLFE